MNLQGDKFDTIASQVIQECELGSVVSLAGSEAQNLQDFLALAIRKSVLDER